MTSVAAILKTSTCIPFGNAAEPQLDITDQTSYSFFLAHNIYDDVSGCHDIDLFVAHFNGDKKAEKRLKAKRALSV